MKMISIRSFTINNKCVKLKLEIQEIRNLFNKPLITFSEMTVINQWYLKRIANNLSLTIKLRKKLTCFL